MTLVPAGDGLPARVVGVWAEEKLFYIERYIDIFSTGMKYKWKRRAYIDLFSGPGKDVVEGTTNEIDGSPLLALKTRSPFTDVYLNDIDPIATSALRARAPANSQMALTIRHLDCNTAARDAIGALQLDKAGTIGLAVVDPTGFQIQFDSLKALTVGRPIDLIVTLMTGYLKRFIASPDLERRLDPFFGSPRWRSLVDLKSAGQRVTFRHLLDFYEQQLRDIGYAHVDDDIRILNSNEATIYHLIFASKHPRGAEFFKKISQRSFGGQRRLFA